MAVLNDAPTLATVTGVAVQWDGLQQLGGIHRVFPQLTIMQSETECGNNHWQPGYNRNKAPNDFSYAAYTWRKFRDFIAAGSSSYFLWNMVLDEQGKNIDSVSRWPQNSAVVVDRSAHRSIYTPMYWATKHYSGLIDVGARMVQTDGKYSDRIAFVNPDGTAVVELLNAERAPTRITVAIGTRSFAVELPAESFATLVVPKA
jgi:glucosylceramidase